LAAATAAATAAAMEAVVAAAAGYTPRVHVAALGRACRSLARPEQDVKYTLPPFWVVVNV
jgi:hypothetical protein